MLDGGNPEKQGAFSNLFMEILIHNKVKIALFQLNSAC